MTFKGDRPSLPVDIEPAEVLQNNPEPESPERSRARLSRRQITGALVSTGLLIVAGLTGYKLHGSSREPAATPAVHTLDGRHSFDRGRLYGEAVTRGRQLQAHLHAGLRTHHPTQVMLWRGTVEHRGPAGWQPVYKDPIALDRSEVLQEPYVRPGGLVLSYMGIVGGNKADGLSVKPVAFTADDRFVPAVEGHDSLFTYSVYATTYQDAQSSSHSYELVAYDPSGSRQVANPDGTVITPGHTL